MRFTHDGVSKKVRARTIDTPIAALAKALRQATEGLQAPSKVVAGKIDATPDAVRNWMNGRCGPSFEHVIALIAAYPEVADLVDELTGRQRPLTEKERRALEIIRQELEGL